jgi:hypothetical protein
VNEPEPADLCAGCTSLAERPVTRAECQAGLRRIAGLDEETPS